MLIRVAVPVLATALALCAGASALPGSTDARRGGTFRIALDVGSFDSIDPALNNSPAEQIFLRATCAQLMAFPGPTPEVAAGYRVSRDRRTYTFTIRQGFVFSSGEGVTARSFELAIRRLLDPAMRLEEAARLADYVVGGRAFLEGRATTLHGVSAPSRRTLVLRLTKPWPDLLRELATGRFCPVRARLRVDPEGVGAPLPGSGPYHVAAFTPGREVILARNRRYPGRRPRHVDRFVLDLTNTHATAAQEVVEGKADLAFPDPTDYGRLARRYGVNRSQFFTFPDPTVRTPRMLILNTQRPLFRDNATLRRAVSFAINREAFASLVGRHVAAPADQFLSPLAPGFRDVRVYPPRGDLSKARALARRTRRGKAVLYVREMPAALRQAEVLEARLGQIGIDVEIHPIPVQTFLRRVATPGEPFDMAQAVGFGGGYPTPTVLSELFHRSGFPPKGINYSRFDSREYSRLLKRAERLGGGARLRAYGRLDIELARDAVPAVPLVFAKGAVLVSRRAGCHPFTRPLFDLAAVCLRR